MEKYIEKIMELLNTWQSLNTKIVQKIINYEAIIDENALANEGKDTTINEHEENTVTNENEEEAEINENEEETATSENQEEAVINKYEEELWVISKDSFENIEQYLKDEITRSVSAFLGDLQKELIKAKEIEKRSSEKSAKDENEDNEENIQNYHNSNVDKILEKMEEIKEKYAYFIEPSTVERVQKNDKREIEERKTKKTEMVISDKIFSDIVINLFNTIKFKFAETLEKIVKSGEKSLKEERKKVIEKIEKQISDLKSQIVMLQKLIMLCEATGIEVNYDLSNRTLKIDDTKLEYYLRNNGYEEENDNKVSLIEEVYEEFSDILEKFIETYSVYEGGVDRNLFTKQDIIDMTYEEKINYLICRLEGCNLDNKEYFEKFYENPTKARIKAKVASTYLGKKLHEKRNSNRFKNLRFRKEKVDYEAITKRIIEEMIEFEKMYSRGWYQSEIARTIKEMREKISIMTKESTGKELSDKEQKDLSNMKNELSQLEQKFKNILIDWMKENKYFPDKDDNNYSIFANDVLEKLRTQGFQMIKIRELNSSKTISDLSKSGFYVLRRR